MIATQPVPFRGAEDRAWIAATLDGYVERLDAGDHFAHAAYRDGEWACMLGREGMSANGETYTRTLGSELSRTIISHVGQTCVLFAPLARPEAEIHEAMTYWLDVHAPRDLVTVPECAIRRGNRLGLLAPLFRALTRSRVAIVGPRHLRDLPESVVIARRFIETPKIAWREADTLAEEVEGCVAAGADVVLIAAGMAAELVIHRAWPRVRGLASLIDIGSVLDPYVGVFSRSTHRNPIWRRDVMPRNVC